MRRAAKTLGVAAPKSRGPKPDLELLTLLREEISKRLDDLPEDDHVKCAVCGEIATDDTVFCPYCGDEGSVSEEEAKRVDTTASDGDDEDEAESGPDEEESEGDDDSDEDEEAEDGDEEVSDEEVAEVVDEGVGIAKGAKITSSVRAGLKGMERELEAAIGRIVELKKSAVGLSYDIGLECRQIRDKQLFKARGYASFKDFAKSELPFTRESALQLIAIVEKHSREDYATIGYAKLRVIAAVGDEDVKEELITAARKGATTKELSERASAANGTVTPPAPESSRKKAPDAEKGERITLIGKIGAKKQVVEFHNSASGEVLKNVGMFQKKGFVPSAYAELEVAPGVFVRVGLRVGANYELEGLTIRFVRASDS